MFFFVCFLSESSINNMLFFFSQIIGRELKKESMVLFFNLLSPCYFTGNAVFSMKKIIFLINYDFGPPAELKKEYGVFFEMFVVVEGM